MDWSYDLLPKVEKVVLRRLAVFRGTFAIEAAADIARNLAVTRDSPKWVLGDGHEHV